MRHSKWEVTSRRQSDRNGLDDVETVNKLTQRRRGSVSLREQFRTKSFEAERIFLSVLRSCSKCTTRLATAFVHCSEREDEHDAARFVEHDALILFPWLLVF